MQPCTYLKRLIKPTGNFSLQTRSSDKSNYGNHFFWFKCFLGSLSFEMSQRRRKEQKITFKRFIHCRKFVLVLLVDQNKASPALPRKWTLPQSSSVHLFFLMLSCSCIVDVHHYCAILQLCAMSHYTVGQSVCWLVF